MAGKGGLNLTHSEPLTEFISRYGEHPERWRDLLSGFSPTDLCTWARGLGTDTFVGTSGRVFPLEKKAAPLLRRWIERLRNQGVEFRARHRLLNVRYDAKGGWIVAFEHRDSTVTLSARSVILALGGASWPQTGSDGKWIDLIEKLGVTVRSLAPANCGYEVAWPAGVLERCEGRPIKNIAITVEEKTVRGELLITRYGLEGGALYQVGPWLRKMGKPMLTIDLKPSATVEHLAEKLSALEKITAGEASRAGRLGFVAESLLEIGGFAGSARDWAKRIKAWPIVFRGPRPIAEAISTAGGIRWENLDENLMFKTRPGLFCAGEMIDWEAPTGGYLLQGCMATGTRAGAGAIQFLQSNRTGQFS